jgi:hypothetical protein
MLILQIALGIVLAVVLLAFLPQILSISIWLAVAAVVAAVVIGAVVFSYDLIGEYIPNLSTAISVFFLIAIIFLIYKYVSDLMSSTSARRAEKIQEINLEHKELLNYKSTVYPSTKLTEIKLIISAIWDNFNTIGKIALTCCFLLFGYGWLVGWLVQ